MTPGVEVYFLNQNQKTPSPVFTWVPCLFQDMAEGCNVYQNDHGTNDINYGDIY